MTGLCHYNIILGDRESWTPTCVIVGQVLVVLLPLLDRPEHLPRPVIELTTSVTLTGEGPELDLSPARTNAGNDTSLGVTDEFFHTV